MTDFVEGPVKSVKHWSDGKGADVELQEDDNKYFYYGKMDLRVGAPYRLEVKRGAGEHSNKWEILDAKLIMSNPQPPPPPPAAGHIQPGRKEVRMAFEDFQNLMAQKSSLKEAKVKSLYIAVKIYAAMNKIERDPVAAAQEVVKIASVIEECLV